MKRLKHIVILDPIPFAGGSKVSTKHILSQLESKPVRISILTSDPDTWAKTQAYVKTLHMPKQLEKTEQGLSYFARHFLIALQLLWLRLFVGRMDTALAASGPGVDLGLYLARFLLGYRLVQWYMARLHAQEPLAAAYCLPMKSIILTPRGIR
ncbi:hypothetical protein [Grimontia sedimenti]|uniref:hypothetical protein n=1 Tax=Grimontia sedimenti TaxID=2711294 RepID=UPI001F3D79A2|nr:hypothetical protein [Grimontia sedimenti]